MSPRLPVVNGAELLRALERDGWRELRRRGSHAILGHPTNPGRTVVPVHAGATLPSGIVARVPKDDGLTADELRRLL
jgi:predicted RNA binding protein YcfA (HicA-like mRNA interferase family)